MTEAELQIETEKILNAHPLGPLMLAKALLTWSIMSVEGVAEELDRTKPHTNLFDANLALISTSVTSEMVLDRYMASYSLAWDMDIDLNLQSSALSLVTSSPEAPRVLVETLIAFEKKQGKHTKRHRKRISDLQKIYNTMKSTENPDDDAQQLQQLTELLRRNK